jgi:hypothetical protein
VGARGLGLLLLLALVGGAAGWAYAEQSGRPGFSGAAPAPLAAAGPALPYTPPEVTKPDADLPPLAEGFTTHDERLGVAGAGGVVLPVPNGWGRTTLRDAEARWIPPGAETGGGYSVRVQVVDLQRSLAQAVAERAAALDFDTRLSDLEILDQQGDTLRASFILDGWRKLQVTRWVSFDGNGIDLEISATGRLIDERGLEALVSKLATEAYRQAPVEPRDGSLSDPSDTASPSSSTTGG